jgi:hypothetical protein
MTENNQPSIIPPEQEASESDFMEALRAAKEAARSAMDEVVVGGDTTLTVQDSLVGSEFYLELNGEAVSGVFRVEGLTSYRLTPTGPENAPIVVAKMVERDGNIPFNRWLRATVESDSPDGRPSRTLSVVAVDDGEETRRWTLRGAKITEVSYHTFDTGSGELVEERVTVTYEELEEQWTWSDAQR